MGLKTAHLAIDRSRLPQDRSDLGIRLFRGSVAKMKADRPPADMVLIRPMPDLLSEEEAVGPEPRLRLVLCGMRLKLSDGTVAQGSGLLVVTGRRFIGMIGDGAVAGGPPLASGKSEHAFCFAVGRDDLADPQIKKHLITGSEFSFRDKDRLPGGFQLTIFSIAAAISDGKMIYWQDKNMLRDLSDEGRQKFI
jgi:hypothetical protein